MSHMDKIVQINGDFFLVFCLLGYLKVSAAKDSDLVCQAGAKWDEINRILEEKGIDLFFPVSISMVHCMRFSI